MLFGGMVVLSQQYEWAERRLEPIERKELQTAAEGVRTWPRIIGYALGATWLVGLGILWLIGPDEPSSWPLRDSWWLVGSPATAVNLIAPGSLARGLPNSSHRRFRPKQPPPGPH